MAKIFKNLFLYIAIALLIIILIRTIMGITEPFNLDTLLTILQNSPTIELTSPNVTITGDWGIFDFLRNILNMFQHFVDFITSTIQLILNFFGFVSYYLFNFLGVQLMF